MASTNQDPDLQSLAELAGLSTTWHDAFGALHHVSDDSLLALLAALGYPAHNASQKRDSLHRLHAGRLAETAAAPLRILNVGEALVMPMPGPGVRSYRLMLESGHQYDGVATQLGSGMLRLAPISEPGYHTLMIGQACVPLAVCPLQCPTVGVRADHAGRAWGVAVQLYSLVGAPREGLAGWGNAGDFATLGDFVAGAAGQGASAVAISPVHALFPAAPERYSPYSPSSRLFLNTAFAAPDPVLGYETIQRALHGDGSAPARIAARTSDDVSLDDLPSAIDWQTLVPARQALLRRLFDQIGTKLPDSLAHDLLLFRRDGGPALEHHARYEALHAWYRPRLGPESGWQDWPVALHDPSGPAADHFAKAHRADVDFHIFLQWLADRGLAEVQQKARDGGMSVGLITDLAIGTDRRGSHAWSRQADMLQGVLVGAPPDLIQPLGQNWNITAFSPYVLRRTEYKAFIETLRAGLRHAGGIRVDHIMGLARMWLIADGAPASQGAYLRYPLRDLLRLLALEAWCHRAIVIGENLGTVPPGLNEQLQEKGVLGTSVLWFQQHGIWPDWNMATTTTHDLPTVEGWWRGRDIQWRREMGELTDASAQAQQDAREADKLALLRQLDMDSMPLQTPRQEILEYVAAKPSPLTMVPIEDLLGLAEQPNLPGAAPDAKPATAPSALRRHPSWRQTLPVSVEALFADDNVRLSLDSVRRGRARSSIT